MFDHVDFFLIKNGLQVKCIIDLSKEDSDLVEKINNITWIIEEDGIKVSSEHRIGINIFSTPFTHTFTDEGKYDFNLKINNEEPKSKRVDIVILPHEGEIISLDGDCLVKLNDWIVIDKKTKNDKNVIICKADSVLHESITAYGLSGKATEVSLKEIYLYNTKRDFGWIQGEHERIPDKFEAIRKTTVYCQPEQLELAEEPIDNDIAITKKTVNNIEVEGIWNWLKNNRRVVISGNDSQGNSFSGKATLSIVDINQEQKKYPFITVKLVLDDNEKELILKRDTVKIYGNVVAASQGETRREVLGSGDGRKASQMFVLKQVSKDAHLTYVSAATATGSASTLKVFVNDIRWHETDILSNCTSIDQKFITKTDEEGGVSVIFGNGKKGARLPTGTENVRAEYRTGLGDAGNVKPRQISLLVDRPLGVKEVTNSVAASSGSDKDKLNQARKNALRAIRVLDRLISVQDYEDFAATYAGIGKAKAVELSNGQRQVVHVTIAGTSSHPDKQLTDNSDLVKNLKRSLYNYGDQQQEVQLAICELLHIVLKANVCILPDYNWEKVEAELRSKLLDAFSFERRELGQYVLLGEVYSIMQAVSGVDYVDVDAFGGIPELVQGNRLTAEEITYAISLQAKTVPMKDDNQKRRLLTLNEIIDAIYFLDFICPKECTVKDTKTACGDCDLPLFCKRYKEFVYKWCNKKHIDIEDCLSEYIVKCSKYCPDVNIASTPRHRLEANLAAFESGDIRPAQLAFLSPNLPETLILKQIK